MFGLLAALALHLSEPFWTLVTIYMLSMPNVGSTVVRMLQRILGTACGALVGLLIASAFPQEPAALVLSFAFALSVFLYVGMAQMFAPYAMYLGAVTIILITSSIWDDPSNVPGRAWMRFENVTVGILVATFGYLILWPVTAKSSLINSLSDKLKRTSDRIDELIELAEQKRTKEVNVTPLLHQNLLASQINLLHAAEMEDQVIKRRRDCILALMTSVDQIATQTVAIQRGFARGRMELASEQLQTKIVQGLSLAKEVCNRMICDLKKEHADHEIDTQAIRDLADEIDRLVSSTESESTIPLGIAVGVLLDSSARTPEVLAWWAGEKTDEFFDSPLQEARLFRPIDKLFKTLNKRALLTTAKGVLAATLAVILAAIADWPNVGATAMVSTIIVIQPTLGATRAKALLRFGGCVVGAFIGVIGIVILSPNTIDLFWFMLFTGGFSWLAGWILGGSDRSAYSGVQLGLAAAITMVTLTPVDDVTSALDRVFGIFLGIAIAMPVVRFFYPISAARELLAAIAEAARTISTGLEMGLGEASEDERIRPTRGYRYRVSWLLADAYRFREEARLEQELEPRDWGPALDTINLLQECMLVLMLLIRNRLRHGIRDHLSKIPEFAELRHGIMLRMNQIADYLEYGTPWPASNIKELYERASQKLEELNVEGSQESREQWAVLAGQVGYYDALAGYIERIEELAVKTRSDYPPTVLARRFSGASLDRKSPVA